MEPTSNHDLHGATVLVRSTLDTAKPPTAMRGSVLVERGDGGRERVRVVIQHPPMFDKPAHQTIFELDEVAVAVLRQSAVEDSYTFTVDQPLDPMPAGSRLGPG